MASTILQSVVARCRDNFTTNSATSVVVSGTRRRLSGLTAGSFLDISAEASFSTGAAADVTAQVYIGATIAAAAAIAEGSAQSIVTAADYGSLSIRTLYGPITAAQAASGLVVDLRIATSADTVSITAITTPTKYGASVRVDELSLAAPVGRPPCIPNLLLWLKADSGIEYNRTTGAVTSWTDSGTAKTLAYNTQTGNFTAGLILTGGTSGATATIHSDTDAGTTGTLVLTDISGTFAAAEVITDSSTGSATVASAPAALSIVGGATAPTYESSVINSLPGVYFDITKAATLSLADLPAQATAFEVFAVVKVDAFVNAGATLLSAPTASSAACLQVCLTNATVNRPALLRTSGPEYVSAGTTTSSGKALYRYRYNKGTTTGAAGLNAGAETTDTSFDETLTKWSTIGSSNGGTFKVGGFRLCELIIFAVPQVSTEDVMSVSDVTSVLDYLNGKFQIY